MSSTTLERGSKNNFYSNSTLTLQGAFTIIKKNYTDKGIAKDMMSVTTRCREKRRRLEAFAKRLRLPPSRLLTEPTVG